jgi:hypothetical protein
MEATESLTSILDIFYYYRPGSLSILLFEKCEINDGYLVSYILMANVVACPASNWHPTNQRMRTHVIFLTAEESFVQVVLFVFFGFWLPLAAWHFYL